MTIRSAFILIVALMLTAAAPLKPRQRPFISPRALKALNLSPTQRSQLDQLEAEFSTEQDLWMKEHRLHRATLRDQITAARTAGDQARLKELNTEWRQQFQPLTQLREKYRNRLRELLTEQQKTRLDEALTRRHRKKTSTPENPR